MERYKEEKQTNINSEAEAKAYLKEMIATPEVTDLGQVVVRHDIESSIGPFYTLPEHKTEYPNSVKEAVGQLFHEYNEQFKGLVELNREWDTDYQYASLNRWVQIDMVGLPQRFLDKAETLPVNELKEVLRGNIFEIENSLAMYGTMERINSQNGEQTRFDLVFRTSLDVLRETYGKKVALLAVTEQKYQAMKESEFGKVGNEAVTDEDVYRISGFDKFFSPQEFLEHVTEKDGDSDYLLYVRSSDPVSKLKNPNLHIDIPLLENDETRRIIKAYSITYNIDNPNEPVGSPKRINDTKAYLAPMGMAYRVDHVEDAFTTINRPNDTLVTLNPGLAEYLKSQGMDEEVVNSGNVTIHAKPLQGTYGCYGHISLRTERNKDRKELRDSLKSRGPYVIQPKLKTPVVVDSKTQQAYTYIDRNFFWTDGNTTVFMGGFKHMMPLEHTEAKSGRIHGNGATHWAEIK